MNGTKTVTFSFAVNEQLYDAYETALVIHGEAIKNNFINYVKDLVEEDESSEGLIEAIREVEEMEKNPHLYKSYSCFAEILEELENEI